MTNKEKLKMAIEQDINPKDYYNEIIYQIEKGDEMQRKSNVWQWSFVPVCLMIIISGALFFYYLNSHRAILTNKTYVDQDNNVILNINEIDDNKLGVLTLDVDIKTITANGVNIPVPYKSGVINLPEDLDKSYTYVIYTKESNDSKDYNVLSNYIIEYTNDSDRSIKVAYSNKNKPIRDYYFSDEGSKITTINGVELKIYKFENAYFMEFEYNSYNFDIETSNITEQELSDLLISIFK